MKFVSFLVLLLFIANCCSFSISGVKKKEEKKDSANEIKKDHKHGFIPSQIKCEFLFRFYLTFFIVRFINTVTSFSKCDPCPKQAKCVPAIQCPAHLRMSKKPQLCDLPGSKRTHGLCCFTKQNHTSKDFFKKGKPRANEKNVLENLSKDAKAKFRSMMSREWNQVSPRVKAENMVEPDFFHQMVFG